MRIQEVQLLESGNAGSWTPADWHAAETACASFAGFEAHGSLAIPDGGSSAMRAVAPATSGADAWLTAIWRSTFIVIRLGGEADQSCARFPQICASVWPSGLGELFDHVEAGLAADTAAAGWLAGVVTVTVAPGVLLPLPPHAASARSAPPAAAVVKSFTFISCPLR